MNASLKSEILRALSQADDLPFPETALIQAVRQLARHTQPTVADVTHALHLCESEGYLLGVTDDFTRDRTWTLTAKGKHKAREWE
jgi:DNA-binding MarR family transcriptional regulator